MDKKPNHNEIPYVVAEAYSLLLQHRVVAITETIRENLAEDATGWVFECIAEVPYPNKNNIPCEVPLQVLIPEEFPHEPVDIYTMCKEVTGFPHQDAESSKLCLDEENRAPRDALRLVCYIKWAVEWLKDAANGVLLKQGSPYELPDFSRRLLDSPLPKEFCLIFDESANSYETWEPYIGEFGHVECSWGLGIQALFAVSFRNKDKALVRESGFSSHVLEKNSKIDGKWVIVPDICYKRHRPPQTYEEMDELCARNNLNFYALLKETWNLNNSHKFGILLIGFPVPKTVGSSFTEIHWQPLFFQNLKGFRAQKSRHRLKGPTRKPKQIWQRLKEDGCFAPSQQVPWGSVENVARERLYIRGAHPPEVQSNSIAFFGCGALGSSVAELLARGGVKKLNLFDPDFIKFGNLCRHTLGGSSVGFNKAVALAGRLSRANPLSAIMGYPIGIPLNSHSDETSRQVLADADIFVDCTTSYTAFGWLNQKAIESGKRLISLFFNLHAELLTICISGDSMSCGEIFDDLENSVKKKQTTVNPDVYFHEPSEEDIIIEGAGCWHPSFPALNTHVQILAAHAVDIISHSISSKSKRGLAAIIKRQSVTLNGVQPGPLVEVAWTKEY